MELLLTIAIVARLAIENIGLLLTIDDILWCVETDSDLLSTACVLTVLVGCASVNSITVVGLYLFNSTKYKPVSADIRVQNGLFRLSV